MNGLNRVKYMSRAQTVPVRTNRSREVDRIYVTHTHVTNEIRIWAVNPVRKGQVQVMLPLYLSTAP